jgi:hypothetical protein
MRSARIVLGMSTQQPAHVAPSSSSPPRPRPAITTALRARAMQLAAVARCDVRTALRALTQGIESIRSLRVREDLERAMLQLAAEGAND